MNAVVILCTAPDQATAEHLAGLALEARLAACVTMLAGTTSWYLWQGKMAQSSEIQMLLKCDSDHQQALCDLLKEAPLTTYPNCWRCRFNMETVNTCHGCTHLSLNYDSADAVCLPAGARITLFQPGDQPLCAGRSGVYV